MHVISKAQKLVLFVPEAEKTVSFPAGAIISPYGQDNERPVVVVCNATDNGGTWQGANGVDGVIIINEVDQENAKLIMQEFDYSIEGLQRSIAKAVELGFTDQYTSNYAFVQKRMAVVDATGYLGLFRRQDDTPVEIYKDDSGVIWRVMDGQTHHIEEDILLRTYTQVSGEKLNLEEIPVK